MVTNPSSSVILRRECEAEAGEGVGVKEWMLIGVVGISWIPAKNRERKEKQYNLYMAAGGVGTLCTLKLKMELNRVMITNTSSLC